MEISSVSQSVCLVCSGSGETQQVEFVLCPGCTGDGKMGDSTCIHCGGDRFQSTTVTLQCPECDGSGLPQ